MESSTCNQSSRSTLGVRIVKNSWRRKHPDGELKAKRLGARRRFY
jgi:hypothetical protein